MADEDFSGLSHSEVVEYQSLAGEIADSNGRQVSGHWEAGYWTNPAKQARFGALEAKRGGAQSRQGAVTSAAQAEVERLMRDPRYWSDQRLQDRALALLSGEARPQPAVREVAASAQQQALFDRLDDLGALVENGAGLAEAFEASLSESAQRFAYELLAHAGKDWAFYANRKQNTAEWRELNNWLATLKKHSPADYDAICHVMG